MMMKEPTKGEIYPDTFSGHSMLLQEKRKDGNNLYMDLHDCSYVICTHDALFAYPPRTEAFAPVGVNHAGK